MADNINDDTLDNPINPKSENLSDEVIPATEPDTIIQNQETENMEVHHHPDLHHKPKKWKEYFLEFLMIFLAVTMGFFAESLREHVTDHAKEKEFILSMIEDAKTDTTNIHAAITLNKKRILNLDTLGNRCFNFGLPGNSEAGLYHSLLPALRHPDFVSPTERTLIQLKSAGGMRLIQNKVAADSIIQYDDFAKKLTNQQVWYENALTALLEPSMHLFNQKYFTIDPITFKRTATSYDSAKLISLDKTLIIEFGNRVSMYEAIVVYYIKRLEEGNQHAANLIQTLQKEYNLE